MERAACPVRRAVLLAVEGQIAGRQAVRGCEYVTGTGNKLVQAEGEERAPLGVRGLVGKQQETAEIIEAFGGGTSTGRLKQVRGLGQRLGRLVRHPPAVGLIVLPLKPEGCLGPRCYRMTAERCVIGTIWDSSSRRRQGSAASVGAASSVIRRKGLGNDVRRRDGCPEQAGSDAGDGVIALVSAALCRHGRAGADAKEVGIGAVTHPANQHGHVGALPTPVSMEFVKDEEAQILGLLDHLRVRRGMPGQHEFKHDVIGQQNVRRVRCECLPIFCALLSSISSEADRFATLRIAKAEILLQHSSS